MDIISITRYLSDPRRDHKKEHSLDCIIYISVAAILAGAESWYEVEEFGLLRESFFASRIKDFRGVPSHDTFNRVFQLLDPVHLERCFRVWIREICGKYSGVVAIDGKEVCGSRHKNPDGSISKLHMVSAWAVANGITLGQEKVSDKSNEIKAIPALIEALDLKDCILTIDAMGCQKEIVRAIIKKEADYVICLKGNQGNFHSTIQRWFDDFDHKHVPSTRYDTYTKEESGHGRIERRKCTVYSNGVLEDIFKGWCGLKSVARVCSYRKETASGKESEDVRYFITSLGLDAQKISECVRDHWSIENNLHWQLDVTFREDDTRKKGNAAQNFSLINKIALMAIKKNPKKGSLKGKRKAAGWDQAFLVELLEADWE